MLSAPTTRWRGRMTDEHPATELARELVALMDKTELTMAEGRRIFVLRDSYAIVIARRLLALEAVVEAAHEAATPKPIDTAPKDGTKILLLKIAGHPAHPPDRQSTRLTSSH